MHVRLSLTVYDEQRELEIRSISSLLMPTSRERRQGKQDTCLHVRLSMTVYDEQRELGIRSISSLLMQEENRESRQGEYAVFPAC